MMGSRLERLPICGSGTHGINSIILVKGADHGY